jgi:hypothetical protein
MRNGTYYLNNSGSRWVSYPKEKVLVFSGADSYCKVRTIQYYESFGNFASAHLKYKGKMVSALLEDCNGRKVFFVDYLDKY